MVKSEKNLLILDEFLRDDSKIFLNNYFGSYEELN